MPPAWLQVPQERNASGSPQEEEDEPSYGFPSVQDEYQMGIATATREEIEELVGATMPEGEPAPETEQRATKAPKRMIPTMIKTEPGEDVKPK